MKERKKYKRTENLIKDIIKKINSFKNMPETKKIKKYIKEKYNISDTHITIYLYPIIKKQGNFQIKRIKNKYYFKTSPI